MSVHVEAAHSWLLLQKFDFVSGDRFFLQDCITTVISIHSDLDQLLNYIYILQTIDETWIVKHGIMLQTRLF